MNKKLSAWQHQEFQNNSCSSLSPCPAASDLYSAAQSVTLSEPVKLTWVTFALKRTWVCHGLCECSTFPEKYQNHENGAVSGGLVSSGCRKINWLLRTTLTSCSQAHQRETWTGVNVAIMLEWQLGRKLGTGWLGSRRAEPPLCFQEQFKVLILTYKTICVLNSSYLRNQLWGYG